MAAVFYGYFFSYGYIGLVIASAVLWSKVFNLSTEYIRKYIHIMLGFTWVILCHYLKGTIHIVIIPISFVVVNCLEFFSAENYRTYDSDGEKFVLIHTFFSVLHSMERTGEEKSPGTVYYAVSVTLMSMICFIRPEAMISAGIGIFCMAFGDGMASLVGERVTGIMARKVVGTKTFAGTVTCIIFAFAGSCLFLFCMQQNIPIGRLILLSVMIGLLELPGKGLDNITVPLGGMLMAYCLI